METVISEKGPIFYWRELKRIIGAYGSESAKQKVLDQIVQCFETFSDPEHKAHFLYLYSEVLNNLGNPLESYQIRRSVEDLFPGTFFSRVASDSCKLNFVENGGRLVPVPPFVFSVQIEPTNYCNIDCIMCSRNKKRPLGHMPFSLYKRIVDQSLEAGAVGIRLYHMGEPLLHPKIVEMVSYFAHQVRQLGTRSPMLPRSLNIQTNGTLLTMDLARTLMTAGINDISFSIDGRNADEYERIRRRAKFATVMENLNQTRNVRDVLGFQTRINVAVLDMGLNDDDRKRLTRFYTDNGSDTVVFNPCAPSPGKQVINKVGEVVPCDAETATDKPPNHESSRPDEREDLSRHVLDRMAVMWNGDIGATCGEPSGEGIIGSIDHMSLPEAYAIKMRGLGFETVSRNQPVQADETVRPTM